MIKKIDWQIIGTGLIISVIALFTLLSTTIDSSGNLDFGGIVLKQVLFIGIGLVSWYFLARMDYTFFKHYQLSGAFFVITVVLLILTLMIGPNINGAKRWLVIAGVQFQISELAKIAIILLTASIMSLKDRHNEWKLAVISFIPTAIIIALIYLQPHGAMVLIVFALWFLVVFTMISDQARSLLMLVIFASIGLGTFMMLNNGDLVVSMGAIVLSVVVFVLSFFGRDSGKKLFTWALIAGAVLGVTLGFVWDKLLLEHQKNRIEAFINPSATSTSEGFNVDQSRVAIGSGQFFGKGFGNGTQSRLNYLPEHQTDFIFAAYAEEFGLFGTILLLFLYGFLVFKLFFTSTKIVDTFGGVVLVVLGMKLLLEIFINVGTNTGMIPATGIPLPLFSAGGSITIATFLILGIVQSIISHNKLNEVNVIDYE